jgi:SNF2 family DNA or RNA helicase
MLECLQIGFMITHFHAKYFAHELSIQYANQGVDRLSQSLFNASVDLNPHQIEAALFALNNPLSQGVVLADEVGLGKTIEAGLVLCQYWAERKRKLLIICPAALRRQWAQELLDKFNLPSQILDRKTWSTLQKQGIANPLDNSCVSIMSYHYAAKLEEQLVAHVWNLVVIDEAHKLRNSHRLSNKIGQGLKRALAGRKKLLLTATPLQNSLIELYGLSSMIDEHIFGDEKAFRKQYMNGEGDHAELKSRMSHFVKRTLRKQVLEYVRYTQRKTFTIPFKPSNTEQALYDSVTTFLERDQSYALPKQQRQLTGCCAK